MLERRICFALWHCWFRWTCFRKCVYVAIYSTCVTETAATIPDQCTLYVEAVNALIVEFQQIHNLQYCLDSRSSACQLTLLIIPHFTSIYILQEVLALPVVRQLVKMCPWKITLLMETSTCMTLWKSQKLNNIA